MSRIKKPNLVSLTTVNADGSRYAVHPADANGRFTIARRIFAVVLLAVYILLPWIPINGNPAVLFDLAHRRFHFMGLTFLSEDLWIGFFLLTGLGFSLFYVTSLFGRLWCGWACPYTVFLDHVYRRIERWIDGDAVQRRRLDAAPWTLSKTVRRVIKHGLFILVSLLLAHIFVSYFVSIPRLYDYMRSSPMNNLKAFGTMAFLAGAFYYCFAFFREQFCVIVCPYGRIQSALTDDDTVVIGYDSRRGEPRGKAKDSSAGDCVDCFRCVQVCPTGIDIRNGLQMECIGCSYCIDACDDIMDKTGRARGLIRYGSTRSFAGEKTRFVRPRTLVYTGFMILGALMMTIFLGSLRSAKIELIRMPGQPFYLGEEVIRNQFRLQLVNKQQRPVKFHFRTEGMPEEIQIMGLPEEVEVGPSKEMNQTLILALPVSKFKSEFHFRVFADVSPGHVSVMHGAKFLGPSPYTLRKDTNNP